MHHATPQRRGEGGGITQAEWWERKERERKGEKAPSRKLGLDLGRFYF